jgi:hypothetical protein
MINKHTTGRGFFAINRHVWKLLCGLNNINFTAAYLTIACGTGADNRTSSWSAQAIENHVGINRTRAREPIRELIARGFMTLTQLSTRTHPQYELQPLAVPLKIAQEAVPEIARLVARCEGPRFKLQAPKRRVVGRPVTPKTMEGWKMNGLLWGIGNDYVLMPPEPDQESGDTDLIWLPNTLITGTGRGEPSPVNLLRIVRNLPALRLLIDLYHEQNLVLDGGISRRVMHQNYKRQRRGAYGRFAVMGFNPVGCTASETTATETFWQQARLDGSHTNRIWEAINCLTRMGLLGVFPQLVEHDGRDAEIIHSLATEGEAFERDVATAASDAAIRCLGKELALNVIQEVDLLVPVDREYESVQAIGVYRLTYRPHTSRTAAWVKRAHAVSQEWINTYNAIAAERDDVVLGNLS